MAKKTTKKPAEETGADEVEPTVLEEPTADSEGAGAADDDMPGYKDQNVWMRGLWMLVLAFLFGVGEFILGVAAVFQFLWLLFGKKKNDQIAAFGKDLSAWLAQVALFQTGATDDKPFPFSKWGASD